MSSAGFARLLETLGPDAEHAAHAYERLRRALKKFFDWRGAWPPEECADETLDRLARKLEEGTAVADVQHYARGIARMVLLERRRVPLVTSLDEHRDLAVASAATTDEVNEQHGCLDRCLDELRLDDRTLLLDYYAGERAEKIANRRRLAAGLRISDNALRSRVQRLRERLEVCVRECLARAGDL